MNRNPSLLLDTCVWLDAFDGTRPGCKDANELLEQSLSGNVPILYAMTSLKDVYYLTAMKLKKRMRADQGKLQEDSAAVANQVAWGCVNNMLENATPIALDYSDARLAAKLKATHSDFEDNLIIAALKRADADYLVTTDQQLIKRFPQEAISPEDAIGLLARDM